MWHRCGYAMRWRHDDKVGWAKILGPGVWLDTAVLSTPPLQTKDQLPSTDKSIRHRNILRCSARLNRTAARKNSVKTRRLYIRVRNLWYCAFQCEIDSTEWRYVRRLYVKIFYRPTIAVQSLLLFLRINTHKLALFAQVTQWFTHSPIKNVVCKTYLRTMSNVA